MDKNSNSYVVLFAVVVCVVCSAALSVTFNGLSDLIKANQKFDIQKNVLKACRLWDPVNEADKPREELEQLYATRIEQMLIDRKTAEPLTGKSDAELAKIRKAQSKINKFTERDYLDVYTAKDASGKVVAYCLPTYAYGLWSWLSGFIALGPDVDEVLGITYYDDGETPGLGGEVNNLGWQETWRGKKIFDDSGELVSIKVVKGGASPDVPEHVAHGVDGLSGATITGDGVTRDLKDNLTAYLPYLERLR